MKRMAFVSVNLKIRSLKAIQTARETDTLDRDRDTLERETTTFKNFFFFFCHTFPYNINR